MRTRITLALGLSASLLAAPAYAQQRGATTPNFGQQVQQQVLNNLQNRALGQPTYPNQGYGQYPSQGQYSNPGYYSNQNPYQANRPYQAQRPVYGQNAYQPTQNYAQPGYRQDQQVQRYQLPAQYSGYAPGSQLTYGGASYVVNQDGTMSPATRPLPAPAVQRYQIPAQYAGAAPGSVINYGSASYTINSDRTMSPR